MAASIKRQLAQCCADIAKSSDSSNNQKLRAIALGAQLMGLTAKDEPDERPEVQNALKDLTNL